MEHAFVFEDYTYDQMSHVASLRYSYGSELEFNEQFHFRATPGWHPRNLTHAELAVLKQILRLLHLVAGVSYFKAFLPERIEVRGEPLSEATANFLDHLYIHGLGEYAFLNGVSLKKIRFPVTKASIPKTGHNLRRLILPRCTAIPIGGGKDSIVTTELLKGSDESLVLFLVGDAEPQLETVKAAGLPYIQVHRTIDPQLFELNQRGAKNGHVPITGIVSLVAIASAIIYGYDAIAMSNERSANVGNTIYDGIEINHQYSKSFGFEKRLSSYMEQNITEDIRYFSFLRPLSEIAITRIFAGLKQYHSIFRSCGAAYRQNPSKRLKNWCGNCDKCRFVFLALAPFVSKQQLTSIFGRNLLDDETQLAGYRTLTGLVGHKPFECVGEVVESAATMLKLRQLGEWTYAYVVNEVSGELAHSSDAEHLDFDNLFVVTNDHRVPPHLIEVLRAHVGALRSEPSRYAA